MHRMRTLMRSLVAVAAVLAFPLVLARLGFLPSMPRVATLSAVRHFAGSVDEDLLAAAVVRDVVRIAWALWAYLGVCTIVTALVRLLDRLGHGSLRRRWEQLAPRSVLVAANLLLMVGASLTPRVAQAATPVAAVPATAPQSPGPTAPGLVVQSRQVEAAPTSGGTYLVERGDTLWDVAARLLGSPLRWRDIADASGLSDPGRIYPGMVLTLPATSSAPASVRYEVEVGDNLTTIAQREYGRASAWSLIWEASRGTAMPDGRVFDDPGRIYPGMVLTLPATSSAPASVALPQPAPAQPPAAPATPIPTTEAPAQPPEVRAPVPKEARAPAPEAGPTRTPDEMTRAWSALSHGVPVPGGLLPPVVVSSLIAVMILARRRRRSRLPLGCPEPFRPPGPVVTAIRQTPAQADFDRLGAHVAGLLAVYGATGRQLPRVVGAWDDGESVRFLLAGESQDGTDPETGVTVVCEAVGSGRTVARTTAPPDQGGREPVFVEDLLVPVGLRQGDGWLHVPLLGPALAVMGDGADVLVVGLLMAAGLRARTELNVTIAGELLAGARSPEGIDLPPFERISLDELGARLWDETAQRSRWLANALADSFAQARAEGRSQAPAYETFAQACAECPGQPAWVLVLDPESATAHGPALDRLAKLGVGVLVLGDAPAATRRLELADGVLSVSAPDLGTLADLEPYEWPAGLVEEVEAATVVQEARPDDEGAPDEVEAARIAGPGPAAPPTAGVFEDAKASASVHLHLFNGFRVMRDAEELPKLSSAQIRELLAKLAAEGPVTAQDLRQMLWPDEHDARTSSRRRVSMNTLASMARGWLGDPGLLRLTADGYRLEGVWVDLRAFQAALDCGDLAAAVDLYAGDLLPGEGEMWGWANRLRDDVRSRYFGAAARLATGLLEAGDAAGALTVIEPTLEGDGGCVEVLVQIAMRVDAALGNPDGVRRRLRQLAEDLHQDASDETQELAAELLAEIRRPGRRPPLRLVEGDDASGDRSSGTWQGSGSPEPNVRQQL